MPVTPQKQDVEASTTMSYFPHSKDAQIKVYLYYGFDVIHFVLLSPEDCMATMISTYHMPPFMQLSIYKQGIICYLIVSNITNLKKLRRQSEIISYMYTCI